MNRLLEIGFAPAGHWLLRGENIVYELANFRTQRNILYAFVCDGEVKYVGKTVQPLRSRMNGYQNPGNGQTTNIRNNALIKAALTHGTAVEILALPDNGLMHYGQFHLNLAAGLEDSIINVLKPEWNGQRMTPTTESETPRVSRDEPTQELDAQEQQVFALTLQPTYFQQGFFNVGVGQSSLFGSDGEKIEIFCGNAEVPVWGTINRRANANQSPRIFGGPAVRQWFQSHVAPGAQIWIVVQSPTSIRISLTDPTTCIG